LNESNALHPASDAKIFISYRRDDTAGHVGHLYRTLVGVFGAARVFRDIQSIEAGQEFAAVIRDAVRSSGVLLAVIGRHWLTHPAGRRRAFQPGSDLVRTEIETALESGIPVIPVLVDGAKVPDARELPEGLAPLAARQAVELTDRHWDADVAELISAIDRVIGGRPRTAHAAPRDAAVGSTAATGSPGRPRSRRARKAGAIFGGVLGVGGLLAVGLALLLRSRPREIHGWMMSLGADSVSVYRVWGSSTRDVFALGMVRTPPGRSRPEIFRYDGASWRPTFPAELASTSPSFADIGGSAADNVYAVGSEGEEPEQRGAVWRYDGAWRRLAIPAAAGLRDHNYGGVWASTPRDVFVVGSASMVGASAGPTKTVGVVVHYDGSAWRHSQLPSNVAELRAVWGGSAHDVFALGADSAHSRPVFFRYDGSRWRRMPVPADWQYSLIALWGSSGDDVYAVGTASDGTGVIVHFDGAEWRRVPLPLLATRWFNDVWGTSARDVIAVGGPSPDEALFLYDGTQWRPVAIPTSWQPDPNPTNGPMESLQSVWGARDGDVFVIDGRMRLLRGIR
jgi:hypothetical protein